MLELKDDGKFVELSFYVPAYHPKAIPQEAFRTQSNFSYDNFIKEMEAYSKVYADCPVLQYNFVLDLGYGEIRENNNYPIVPFDNTFYYLTNAISRIDNPFIYESKVLKAYFKLIKPLQYQQQIPVKQSKPKRKYRKRTGIPRGIRNEVFKRDNYTCVQCGAKKGDKKPDGTKVVIHCDHIRPIAKGGTDEMSNLQTLCADCNLNKNDVFQKVVE